MGKQTETPWEILNHPTFLYTSRPGDHTIRHVFKGKVIRGTQKALKWALESQSETFRVMSDRLRTFECVSAKEIVVGDLLYFNASGYYITVYNLSIRNDYFGDHIVINDGIIYRVTKVWREVKKNDVTGDPK